MPPTTNPFAPSAAEASGRKERTEKMTFEEVCWEFIGDWDAGKKPTIEDYCRRYPQFIEPLVDFILDYVTMENRVKRQEARDKANGVTETGPSEWGVEAWRKAMAALGIPTADLLAAKGAGK